MILILNIGFLIGNFVIMAINLICLWKLIRIMNRIDITIVNSVMEHQNDAVEKAKKLYELLNHQIMGSTAWKNACKAYGVNHPL